MKNAVLGYIGKVISSLSLQDDTLTIRFTDGTGVEVYDNGQSCCEHRYMHTDDDLSGVNGGVLYDIELRDVTCDESDWEVHEIQFLVVKTSKGEIVMSSHNEHNGYYGGFSIEFRDAYVLN